MSSTNNANSADTYGWDTAFAIHINDVNASIKRKGTSPKSFNASTVDPTDGHTITVDGDFSDWQITTGGSGKLLHMSTPVKNFTASGKGPKDKKYTYTYGPGYIEIEVELEYLPHTSTAATGTTGTFHDLKVKAKGASGEQVVTVINSGGFGNNTNGGDVPYSDVKPYVEPAMQNWFNEHMQDFVHVFATVNLNRTADKGQFAWLLPTYTSYAYIDQGTLDKSFLGILCMTEGRSADGLSQELSPNAIPEGSKAGFLIAPHRFVQDMLLPSMPLVYKGVTTDDFALKTDKAGLTLANGPVRINDIKDKNGKPHATELNHLDITTSDGSLTINAITQVTVSEGIWAFTEQTASYSLELHELPNNKQTIYYKATDTPTTSHWTKKSPGVGNVGGIAAVIAFMVSVLIGILTGGAGLAISAVILGILAGVASQIPNMIEAANTDESPPIDLLAFNAVDPIKWSDQQDFPLDSVSLNYSVQMGGTPSFGS